MLYPKNKENFSEELFEKPTNEYRGVPFWSWNCKLRKDLLGKEIDHMN